MISDRKIQGMPTRWKRLLLNHLDARLEINVRDEQRMRALRGLQKLGLVRGHPANMRRPRLTVLTKYGKSAAFLILQGDQ